jgi:hypothetical protein
MPSLLLKNMPTHIRKYLLKIQGEIKTEKCISQYSLESTIYKIISQQIENEKNVSKNRPY